jgi:hypothetical protein
MKISEVTEPSDGRLFEQLDADNDTGLATSDLVRIVRQAREGKWSEPMTGDELMDHLGKLLNGG